MSFDLAALKRAVAEHGRVARVVIAAVRGSAPRETGASMLVWQEAGALCQSGTIGGGTLEFHAAKAALNGDEGLSRHALGPDLGQCCGGSVDLLTEVYDATRLASLSQDALIARPAKRASPSDVQPLAVQRVMSQARATGVPPEPHICAGWMIEPISPRTRDLWIWGAGHVGRALVSVLQPLPDVAIHWIDTAPTRFPAQPPEGVAIMPAAQPARLVAHAPTDCDHVIVTYSHALDLELCHQLLGHGFGFAGLIGSRTKWARFRSRLASLGHSAEQISRITCPIGQTHLGKHPQAIAIGVAAQLIDQRTSLRAGKELSA